MPTAAEMTAAKTPMAADLAEGVNSISSNQKITFDLYIRLVLPVDGFVFWVKADMVSKSAIFNAMGFNDVELNQPQIVEQAAKTFTVQGSLHYTTDKTQAEDENYAINRVVFTSESPIEPFNRIGPDTMWVGKFKHLTFAFGAHAFLYQAAELWHYSGDAIYPDMAPQLVDRIEGFSNKQIVSNSIPIWLSMNRYTPKPWEYFGNYTPIYPSYLLPANIKPPWIAVHIPPDSTVAIAGAPLFGKTRDRAQLVQESVKITAYGLRNEAILDFIDFVQQYAESTGLFGIMNQPVVRDEKRLQNELSAIAQKKTVLFDINYYQARSNDLARQLIISAIPTYVVQ